MGGFGFLSGSIALAAVALQATSRLKVGIGLMPAVIRNPAIAAMEIATLADMFLSMPSRWIARRARRCQS